jgi:hypothetical protein
LILEPARRGEGIARKDIVSRCGWGCCVLARLSQFSHFRGIFSRFFIRKTQSPLELAGLLD